MNKFFNIILLIVTVFACMVLANCVGWKKASFQTEANSEHGEPTAEFFGEREFIELLQRMDGFGSKNYSDEEIEKLLEFLQGDDDIGNPYLLPFLGMLSEGYVSTPKPSEQPLANVNENDKVSESRQRITRPHEST